MRALILTFILFLSFTAQAFEDDVVPERRVLFNPVVSSVARTLPRWRVGFQKTGGANINTTLLANALSVGVLDRVELGIVPMFFAVAPGSMNYLAKLNFYKSDNFDWAGIYTETRFKSSVKMNGEVIDRPDLVLRSVNIGLNYHPESSDFMISPFANNVCGHLDSNNLAIYSDSLECKWEWGTDVQWQFKEREWITVAYGFIRDAGLSPYEQMNSGFGIAWSQFRPNELFSRPSLGIYYSPKTSHVQYLISTTFYEF